MFLWPKADDVVQVMGCGTASHRFLTRKDQVLAKFAGFIFATSIHPSFLSLETSKASFQQTPSTRCWGTINADNAADTPTRDDIKCRSTIAGDILRRAVALFSCIA